MTLQRFLSMSHDNEIVKSMNDVFFCVCAWTSLIGVLAVLLSVYVVDLSRPDNVTNVLLMSILAMCLVPHSVGALLCIRLLNTRPVGASLYWAIFVIGFPFAPTICYFTVLRGRGHP